MDGGLDVTITTDSGRRLERRFEPKSTAKELKHHLAKEWSIPVVCQALYLGPVLLSDSDILAEVAGSTEIAIELRASFGLLAQESGYKEPTVDPTAPRDFVATAPSNFQPPLATKTAHDFQPQLAKPISSGRARQDLATPAIDAPSTPVSLLDKLNAQARQLNSMETRLMALQEEVLRIRSATAAQSTLSETLKSGLEGESSQRCKDTQRLRDVLRDLLRLLECLSEGLLFRRHALLEEEVELLSAKLEEREPQTTAKGQVTSLRLASAGDVAQLEQALEDLDGASVNGRNCRGKTPLLFAAAYGRTEAVTSLLARQAAVGAADVFGRGVLHLAAARSGVSDAEQAKLVNRLLKAGANAKMVDTNGTSAMSYAEMSGQKMTASLLRDAGAPNAAGDEVLLLKSRSTHEDMNDMSAALATTPLEVDEPPPAQSQRVSEALPGRLSGLPMPKEPGAAADVLRASQVSVGQLSGQAIPGALVGEATFAPEDVPQGASQRPSQRTSQASSRRRKTDGEEPSRSPGSSRSSYSRSYSRTPSSYSGTPRSERSLSSRSVRSGLRKRSSRSRSPSAPGSRRESKADPSH